MRRTCLTLVMLLFSLSIFAPASAQGIPQPIIIDTDMAVDDWMAILYLLQRDDFAVKAITVTGTGEAHCEPGVKNAMRLTHLSGQGDIPVACGRETPLAGNHTFPRQWRDGVDSLAGLTLPDNPSPAYDGTAVDLLKETINGAPSGMTLLTLGPLTNIADLLADSPEIVANIKLIYVMGGAVKVPGNLGEFVPDNPHAEWNIFVDPLAASRVFQSGVDITLIPLDATNQVPLTGRFYGQLQRDHITPEADFVFQALTRNQDFINSGSYYFWDPLAAAVATDRFLVTHAEGRPLVVVTEEGPESGRTKLDRAGNRVLFVTEVNADRFQQMFLNVLNGRAPDEAPPPRVLTAEEIQTNKAATRRFFEEAWGNNDLTVFDEVTDPGIAVYMNGDFNERDNFVGAFGILHTALPGLTVQVEDLFAENERVAARVILRGTHTGPFFQLPPTGNPVELNFNALLTFADGKITEAWMSIDLLELFFQVGAIPPEVVEAIFGQESQ